MLKPNATEFGNIFVIVNIGCQLNKMQNYLEDKLLLVGRVSSIQDREAAPTKSQQ